MCYNIIVGFGIRFVIKISKNIDGKKLSNIFLSQVDKTHIKKKPETTVSNGHHFYKKGRI